MALNVFEGARRVSYVISAIIVLVGVYILVDSTPNERLYYSVSFPGTPANRAIGQSCPSSGRSTYISGITPKGHKVGITICFVPMGFDDGRDLIPYKTEGNLVFGDTMYSDPVSTYIRKFESKFVLPEADGREIDEKWMGIWLSSKWEIVKNTGLILAGFWLFVYLVGWIIRGFAGIPLNKDHRN